MLVDIRLPDGWTRVPTGEFPQSGDHEFMFRETGQPEWGEVVHYTFPVTPWEFVIRLTSRSND